MTEKKHLQTISQKRKSFAQVLLTEGEPMLMRLLPPIKYDEGGNVIPKRRKWYANFYHKNKHIGVSLGAYEEQLKLAHMNLGKVMEDLNNGKIANGTRKKIRLLKPEKPFRKEYLDVRRNYLDPFFGEIKPNELTSTLMEQYIES